MKKFIITMLLVYMAVVSAVAQRMTDALDRGLVAVKTDAGVFCSWRILAEEYYNVTYNLYRDGVKVNQEPLTVSNFTDVEGTAESKYTVSAVGLGVESGELGVEMNLVFRFRSASLNLPNGTVYISTLNS